MTAAVDRRDAAGVTRGFSPLGGLLAGLLVFDGLVTVVLEALFLPLYAGSTPLPLTALVAAVVNVLLVLGMGTVVSRPMFMALPLLAWMLGFLLCSSGGPGGDIVLEDSWPTLALLACGLIPAGFVLFRRAFPAPQRTR
ncbi:hypothetical protein [Nocardia terpenica]|uniref:hypothetical protein n=1 Tax=Nocardia terpenica TaxID=455432 RepID=UPI000A864DDE|nr:hypothetical protein [Nocardia terpenica]